MRIDEQIKKMIEERNESYVSPCVVEHQFLHDDEQESIERKRHLFEKRKAIIVKSTVDGQILRSDRLDDRMTVNYLVHYQQLVKLPTSFYIEEQLQERQAEFVENLLVSDKKIHRMIDEMKDIGEGEIRNPIYSQPFIYRRREAVQYAERWWNDYNPKYHQFINNCTNFISQCLRAGGAPMVGQPNRSKGWWYSGKNWSYSWAVANTFRWYLSGARSGLRGTEVQTAAELMPGDVICYDFDGDGRWQHSTIVVAKDEFGEPLVNAQTTNSRMRYWNYEDSTAWTPNIQYKFFRIADDM